MAAAATRDTTSDAPRRRGRRRRVAEADGPDPIDVHVGGRMRERRVSLGMSQAVLADHLGLTFQQVQKYELGRNRLSASKLWHAAESLDVPVSYFFDGLRQGARLFEPDELDRAALELTRKIRRLPVDLRERLSAFITSLVRDDD